MIRLPLQHNSLPDLDQRNSDLDAMDEACLEEIGRVLAAHRKTDRFGVTLLHKHFDLAQGEVLLERTDCTTRRLTTEPVIPVDADGALVETIWSFREEGLTVQRACQAYCPMYGDKHAGFKDHR